MAKIQLAAAKRAAANKKNKAGEPLFPVFIEFVFDDLSRYHVKWFYVIVP
jgi:hypothetical protein